YDRLLAKGACFGSKMGWERANWFAQSGETPENAYSFGRQNWHNAVKREMDATRNKAGLFDQTSFAKLLVQGRDAAKALNQICAADIDVEIGRSVYTGLLNERGGYESDLTVMRLAQDRFFIMTGSAQAVHDADWIGRNIPEDAHVTITDVTSSYAVLALMGPNSRTILKKLTSVDLSNAAFPFSTIQEIDIGYATAFANRMTYVGELGWELIVPTEFAVGVYEALHEVGQEHGMIDCGYYALDALRIEKAYRAWGRELTPDINPYQAGLGFAVSMDKADGFIGREALAAAKPKPLTQRIVQFTLADAEPMLWGGELILRNGKPVGEVRSAAYGHTLGCSVALGLLEHESGVDKAFIETGEFEIDLAGQHFKAIAHLRPAYDPLSARPKSDDS
ncbi:aminomethyl transferase family protein, partial [Paraburkholderia aspalathi]|nr:aminomethyl transferase family protein [Paraburkholderia aspalathi]